MSKHNYPLRLDLQCWRGQPAGLAVLAMCDTICPETIMSNQRYKILAVDDEEDVLDVLERALEDDYQVYTAPNGEKALEILEQEPAIDLLITDQRMPQMSGVKLLEEAKRINPTMVRIILTGYTEPGDLIDAINRGEVYRYITKPWDLNDLLLTIRQGLESYQLRKDKERLRNDLELRLNAMTVFLDLSKEAVRARSYEEIIQAVVKYLPYIVTFDACASLFEQEASGKVLLNIHCRRSLHEQALLELRSNVLETYHQISGHKIEEKDVLIQLTGERSAPDEEPSPFESSVQVTLKTEGEISGLIQLVSVNRDVFREDTRQLLDILANQTSDIIRGLKKQLLTERQRLELMVQSLADGVIMVDEQDRVFVINPAARKLLHLPPDTLVSTRYLKDTLGFYPFELVRGWQAEEGSMVKEEIQVFDRFLHSIVSPVTVGNKLVGVAVVLRDITEEKALDDRKEEFVSIISHELRTPLTSIGGALDLLLNRFAGDINSKQERYLSLAKGSCDKLNIIIDELLDLRKLEQGRMKMEMRRVDLSHLVRDAAENYQAAAIERGAELKIVMADQKVPVRGDRNRLHQVLNNLLSNGLKFAVQGGLIQVSLFQTAAMPGLVGVCVYNDGAEIEEQDHQRIFDKFEQARSGRAGAVSGSGLGLSISKSIIEAHGGHIWVESGRGEGTRFILTLPLEEEEIEPTIEEIPGLTEAAVKMKFKSPPRVLVVDDDLDTAYVIKGLLISQGYSVMLANSGDQALSLARERHPDLIIMDIRMPNLDGLQVTEILQHDPETREIPVLVVSVTGSEEDAYRVGASAYLPKPVTLERLKTTVGKLLDSSSLVTRMFTVLIVDDDPAIRAVCKEVLEGQGYSILEAECGSEALEILSKNTVDAILLDLMLPDFDGFQVTEKVRSERSTADIPIIFISARGKTFDKVKAFKMGADDYMVKPFDALELGARVDTVIKRKEREMDSSPNTKLPGSVSVEKELNRRLVSGKPFSLCYLDLDNLKAFNDYYGYAKADGVIQQTGDLIRKAVENLGNSADFVGHIAGDDFVLITTPGKLEEIGQEIISSFDRVIPLYYHVGDRERGFIEAEDRFGQMRQFKIMSISLAAVNVEPGHYRSHAEIAERAAELKKKAKSVEGSVLVQDDEDQADTQS
ncbi:MAG: response regulator [Deltaproteobacteria bacterium]|nr:response regulator [Deltaproteobacteria bacterium]